MRVPEVAVHNIGGKYLRCPQSPQARQIEHLHAMRTRAICDDVGVILIHLDISPVGIHSLRRQASEEDRVLRIRDINEGCAVRHAHQGVLITRLRINPAPDVVARCATHRFKRHSIAEGDAGAGKIASTTAGTARRAGAEWRRYAAPATSAATDDHGPSHNSEKLPMRRHALPLTVTIINPTNFASNSFH